MIALLLSLPLQVEPDRGGAVELATTDPAVAAASFTLAEGYRIELFASERDFPQLENPVSLCFDGAGRLYVACMPSYPMVAPGDAPNDHVLVLEDADADGRADAARVFVDGLNLPTGLELGEGGLFVASQPDLWFVEDTDGDGAADRRELQLTGFATSDTHHALSAFAWDPGGGLLMAEGTFHHTQLETPHGTLRLKDAGILRFEPDTFRVDAPVRYPFANPWGQVHDAFGDWFIADASGGDNYFGNQLSGHLRWPRTHRRIAAFTSKVRPTAGVELVASRAFPAADQGQLLVNNTIGLRGIKRHRVFRAGAGWGSEELDNLLSSSDPNFRPVDLRFGPDGALYVVDWFNPLIGHMQYSLFDERRDRSHGRIWRVTYAGLDPLEPPAIAGASEAALLEHLRLPEDRARYRTRRELRARDRAAVRDATLAWVAGLAADAERERLELEALWVLQGAHAVDRALLERCLNADDERVRAGATHALRYPLFDADAAPLEPAWATARLAERAADESPRVRLEAVLSLTWVAERVAADDAAPAEAALRAFERDVEPFPELAYALDEGAPALLGGAVAKLARGEALDAPGAGVAWLLDRASIETLRALPSSEAVERALLRAPQAPLAVRRDALRTLSAEGAVNEAAEVARLLADARNAADVDDLGALLPLLLSASREDLAAAGEVVDALVQHPVDAVRRIGWRTRVARGGSPAELLASAGDSATRRGDLLGAVADESGAVDRSAWGAAIDGLLVDLDALDAHDALDESEADGFLPTRLVLRVPGEDRIINLSEVEVFDGDLNVALGKPATSSSTDWSGPPEVAVDGVKAGSFGAGGVMAHTAIEDDPWLAIELGAPTPVDAIKVWNRTEAPYDERLEGFSLTLLDEAGAVVWQAEHLPAPDAVGVYRVDLPGGRGARAVRARAVAALAAVAPDRIDVRRAAVWFADDSEALRGAAATALEVAPAQAWDPASFGAVAAALAAQLDGATLEQRLDPGFARYLRLARRLAAIDATALGPLADALAAEASRPSVERIEAGRTVFASKCATCHQDHGRGIAGAYPPLAGSSWATGDPSVPIRVVLHGLNGPIDVDGAAFSGAMAPLGALLTDREVADVLTYVRAAWGNDASAVAPEAVEALRAEHLGRRSMWTARELGRE